MKLNKKIIALATVMAMLGSNYLSSAQEAFEVEPGVAYEESTGTSNLAPAIALGAIAIVAIVAVAVQESGHHHHGHN